MSDTTSWAGTQDADQFAEDLASLHDSQKTLHRLRQESRGRRLRLALASLLIAIVLLGISGLINAFHGDVFAKDLFFWVGMSVVTGSVVGWIVLYTERSLGVEDTAAQLLAESMVGVEQVAAQLKAAVTERQDAPEGA